MPATSSFIVAFTGKPGNFFRLGIAATTAKNKFYIKSTYYKETAFGTPLALSFEKHGMHNVEEAALKKQTIFRIWQSVEKELIQRAKYNESGETQSESVTDRAALVKQYRESMSHTQS